MSNRNKSGAPTFRGPDLIVDRHIYREYRRLILGSLATRTIPVLPYSFDFDEYRGSAWNRLFRGSGFQDESLMETCSAICSRTMGRVLGILKKDWEAKRKLPLQRKYWNDAFDLVHRVTRMLLDVDDSRKATDAIEGAFVNRIVKIRSGTTKFKTLHDQENALVVLGRAGGLLRRYYSET